MKNSRLKYYYLAFTAISMAFSFNANAVLINTASASVTVDGSPITSIDVVSGADVAPDGLGNSINVAGSSLSMQMSGGNLQGSINASGNGHTFDISGGDINGGFAGSGIGHTLDMSGGSIVGDVGASGVSHIFNISGGTIGGDINGSGAFHTFNISGGMFGGDFLTSGYAHIFNFTGMGLNLINDTIQGLLEDGSYIDMKFGSLGVAPPSHYQININNIAPGTGGSIPEPSIIALFGLGLVGLGFARRRRQQ
jgi:hypothetical protein